MTSLKKRKRIVGKLIVNYSRIKKKIIFRILNKVVS